MKIRLTKWAREYADKNRLSREVITHAAKLSKADHRGFTNTGDLQQAEAAANYVAFILRK